MNDEGPRHQLTHLFGGHPGVLEAYEKETEEIATTVISRIEILQGRFAMLLKAADGQELRRAQRWLDQTVEQLAEIPKLLSIDEASAGEFDRLRANKKLKKIGRADLLIAAITLANRDAGHPEPEGFPPGSGLASRELGGLSRARTQWAGSPSALGLAVVTPGTG